MAKDIFTPEQQAFIRELMERYGSSWESFSELRPDCYEQKLALHSLEQLEQYYAVIHTPGKTQVEVQPLCPPWPSGPRKGLLPSTSIISNSQERLRTESTLNSLTHISNFQEAIRKKAESLPVGQSGALLEQLVTLVGVELMEAKQKGGVPVSANMKQLDRLITVEIAKTNNARENTKLALKKQQLNLELQKFQRLTCEKVIEFCEDQEVHRIATSNLPKADKIEQLGLRIFGQDWEDGK